MLKKIARIAAQAALTVLMLTAAVKMCPAVVIEGYTPSGNFKSVSVTDNGELSVQNDTGTAQHIIVDTGTITVSQGAPGTTPWPVTTTVGVSVQVRPSTVGVTVNGQFTVTTARSTCYPADANRQQGVLCNNDPSATMWIGDPTTVTSANGMPVLGGSCFSPDVPAAMIGGLGCISTTTLNGSYIYFKP